MSALSFTRYNPLIKTYFDRLRQKGQPFKVAMVAAMRKLITIINGMVKANTRWDPATA